MIEFQIKNVSRENLDDFVRLCVPANRADEPSFKRGIALKVGWAECMLNERGCIGKLAYYSKTPVGMIQYLPYPDEDVVKITCIFVPNDKHLRKGIGSALLESLIDDVTTPASCFKDMTIKAVVANAFDIPEAFTQREFFRKKGFSAVTGNPYILYYPLKEGVKYKPLKERYTPIGEDRGRVLLFFDGSCPFSIIFIEKTIQLIREVAPDIPIKKINKFDQPEEVAIRGGRVHYCIVNQKPIKSTFFDADNFKREIKRVL